MNVINDSNKRIVYLDFLRAFAIICIVLIHISSHFNKNITNFNFSAIITAFVLIGVPLFFMISGALLIGKSNENFINKRFKRVLSPFLFWVIIYFFCGIIFFNGKFIANYFLDTLFANSSISKVFWFVYCLLGGYLLIPIVNGFLKTEKDKGLKYLLILFTISVILSSLTGFCNIKLNYLNTIVRYLPFASTPIFYFLVGYYLNNKKFNISNGKMVLISIILISIGYILELNYLHTSHGFKFPVANFLINFNLIIESIGVFIFFKYFNLNLISGKLNSLLNNYRLISIIRNLSGCSFGIYFVHCLILDYLFKKGHLFYQFTVGKAYIWIPITFLVIFLISWLIIYLMSKIPILKIGSGFK